MENNIKKDYEGLAKKYNLPSFDSLNNEFEIITIEKEDFLLREIRRKIDEKIELYIKFLESLLQPDTVSLSDIYEYRFFDDKERHDIFELFRKLMFFSRYSIETSITEDNKKSAEFINRLWEEWEDLKNKFSSLVKKTKEDWLNEAKIIEEDKGGYLG